MDRVKFISATLLIGAYGVIVSVAGDKDTVHEVSDDKKWEEILDEFEKHKRDITEKCSKCVVEIYCTKKENVNLDGNICLYNNMSENDFFCDNIFDNDPFSFFDCEGKIEDKHLKGIKKTDIKTNGFVISEDGFVLTNYSTVKDYIKNYKEIKIKICDKFYPVVSAKFDVCSDLALLKVNANKLQCICFDIYENFKNSKNIYKISGNIDCYENIELKTDNNEREVVDKDNAKKNDVKNKDNVFLKKNILNKKNDSKVDVKTKNGKKKNPNNENGKVSSELNNKKYEVNDRSSSRNMNFCTFSNTSKTNMNSNYCLMNVDGKIVGINVNSGKFKSKEVCGYKSMIPSDNIIEVIRYLKNGKDVQYDFNGFKLIDNNENVSKNKNLKINYGCYIHSFSDEMKSLGFVVGDVIIGLNNYKVLNIETLFDIFNVYRNTDMIFKVKRNENDVNINVKFGVMSDVKFKLNKDTLITNDFIFKNKDNGVVLNYKDQNDSTKNNQEIVVKFVEHKEVCNINDIVNIIKKILNRKINTVVNSLTLLIEGHDVNDATCNKKVLGIELK